MFNNTQNDEINGLIGQAPPQSISGMPPLFSPFDMPPPIPSYHYFIAMNGQQYGPYNAQQMAQMVRAGQLALTSKVWRQGLEEWLDLSSLPELTSSLVPTVPTNLPPPLN